MSKLIIDKKYSSPYGLPNKGWMFVEKRGNNYAILRDFLTCKDYIHEIIGGKINNHNVRQVFNNCDRVHTDKLLMVMVFDKKKYPDIKKRIFLTMAYIQRFEAYEGVPLTRFKELTCKEAKQNGKDMAVFLIEGDVTYIESPVLLHWMIATLRSMPYSTNLMKADFDFDAIYNKLNYGDISILVFMHKHKIAAKLMKHHVAKIRPLGLKKIYPKEVDKGSYHSCFGIWAACKNELGSPKYRKAINAIFKEEKIPYKS